MKIFLIFVLLISSQITAFADFSKEEVDYDFDRGKAQRYMREYWKNYNEKYLDFNEIGGDCSNYASQIMHYSGVPFTERTQFPNYNYWYYYGSEWGFNRTSTWTSATEFRKYFGDVLGIGAKVAKSMTTYTVEEAILKFDDIWRAVNPGDIISHGHDLETSYHTQIVYDFGLFDKDIKVSQHSEDALIRSLYDYLLYRQRNGQGDEFIFVIEM